MLLVNIFISNQGRKDNHNQHDHGHHDRREGQNPSDDLAVPFERSTGRHFKISKGKFIMGREREHFLGIFKLQVDEIILP